jgi:hypothetical protein
MRNKAKRIQSKLLLQADSLTAMYPAKGNSPITKLKNNITANQNTIPLENVSNILVPPNLIMLSDGITSETVRYNGINIDTNTLTDCERGFDNTTPKSWFIGTASARNIAAYDHNTFITNIESLQSDAIALSNALSNTNDNINSFETNTNTNITDLQSNIATVKSDLNTHIINELKHVSNEDRIKWDSGIGGGAVDLAPVYNEIGKKVDKNGGVLNSPSVNGGLTADKIFVSGVGADNSHPLLQVGEGVQVYNNTVTSEVLTLDGGLSVYSDVVPAGVHFDAKLDVYGVSDFYNTVSFSGVTTAQTPDLSDDSKKIATTEFVQAKILDEDYISDGIVEPKVNRMCLLSLVFAHGSPIIDLNNYIENGSTALANVPANSPPSEIFTTQNLADVYAFLDVRACTVVPRQGCEQKLTLHDVTHNACEIWCRCAKTTSGSVVAWNSWKRIV